MMRRQFLAPLAFAALVATGALAKDRPVTEEERAKLATAVSEQGCSGGKMEFDIEDSQFEVDDARCSDGRTYDLKFDVSFRLVRKTMED